MDTALAEDDEKARRETGKTIESVRDRVGIGTITNRETTLRSELLEEVSYANKPIRDRRKRILQKADRRTTKKNWKRKFDLSAEGETVHPGVP